MNWWSKCVSMVVAKTASRNVASKAAKISEALLEAKLSFLSRNMVGEEVTLDYESLENLGRNYLIF